MELQMLILLLNGCQINLDSMLFNPRHCTIVGKETCEDKEEPWDKICVPCEEPYDWTLSYDWHETTLDDTFSSIRPVSDELEIQNVIHKTKDGIAELDVYFIPSHGEHPEFSSMLLIYNHGNYAGIEHYLPRLRMLHELGFPIVTWDYRGFGKSLPDTTPSGPEFISDAQEIYDLAKTFAPDPNKIVVYGYSLGGIPSTEQVVYAQEDSETTACALLLEAGFTSAHQMISSVTALDVPGGFITSGYYENEYKIADYDGPVLYMVGSLDTTFPPKYSESFLDLAAQGSEFWEVPNAHHGVSSGGVPDQGLGQYFEHIESFLKTSACWPE